MEIAEIILSYIQVLLNWPFLGACLIFTFILIFKEQIGDFLSRLVSGKIGGFAVEATKPVKQEKVIKEDKIKNPKDRAIEYMKNYPEEAFKEYVHTYNAYFFERIFNIIFGSQINLLEHLDNKKDKKEKWINLITFYNNFMMKTVPPRVTFNQYLGFLESCKFIKITSRENENIVEIIPYGLNFLLYIKSQHPTTYKHRLF